MYHNNFDFLAPDSFQYKESALTLINYGSFSHSMEEPQVPEVLRTPGYPLFIAFIYKLLGTNNMVIIMAHILISLLSVFLIYKILLEISNRKLGILAAIIYSLEPLSLSLIFYILTETLFQLFMMK